MTTMDSVSDSLLQGSSKSRPTVAHQLNRDQILEATRRCLHDEGGDATTIRRIASLLGCAVGSIYRYFGDKDELLYAATQMTLKPALGRLDGGATFEQSVTFYVELARENRRAYQLMFLLASQRDPVAVPPIIWRIIDGWSRQMGDPMRARRAWALLHGLVMLGQSTDEILAALRYLDPPWPKSKDQSAPAESPRPIAATRSDDVCLL